MSWRINVSSYTWPVGLEGVQSRRSLVRGLTRRSISSRSGRKWFFRPQIVKDRSAVDDRDGHFVVGPAWVGQQDLVAWFEQGEECGRHTHNRPGGDEDVFAGGWHAGVALEVASCGLAQRIDSGVGYVLSVAGARVAAGGFDDGLWGGKIGLPDFEVDDLARLFDGPGQVHDLADARAGNGRGDAGKRLHRRWMPGPVAPIICTVL